MELSIDTASELASIAVSREGALRAEMSWRCRRNHTIELLPAIDRLLAQAGVTRTDLRAIFVSIGPGMYTGLRVGIATAQGLASALSLPVAGVGRLELDAYPHAVFDGPIFAVHRAGRGDLAWASYRSDPWREVSPPRLTGPDEVVAQVREACIFAGEVDEALAERLRRAHGERVRIPSPAVLVRRGGILAELGFQRLTSGQAGDPAFLRPVYLRPPAIGPQERK